MPVKRFILLVNPSGGTRHGLEVLENIKPVFAATDLQVHITKHAGHAAELANTLDFSGCEGLCLIGGDGTLHEVVSGLMRREDRGTVPLGIIPGGTGNSVAQHFECTDPIESAQRIAAGNTQPLDVVRVRMGSEDDYCVNIVGWGAVVDINRTAEPLRALGPPRYALAAIINILRAKQRQAKLVIDGQVTQDNFLLAAICNTKFTGKGMQLAPKADPSDGRLDLVVVRHATRFQMLKLFRKVFDGSHVNLPYVEYHQVNSFSIESEDIDCLNLDGELKGTTPVSVDIIPKALKIFV